MRIPKGGIAFFDSGIGGLTVLAECMQSIPDSVFYYYGDNAHAPYGNLPQKQIRRYVFRAMKKFKKLKASAVVLACNTATAVCVEELRKKYEIPIIGAEPAVCPAAKFGGEIFVLATCATCESQRLQILCKKARSLYPDAKITLQPCVELAAKIEKGDFLNIDLSKFLPKGNPTAVVLGCTHYIYVKEQIENFYGCKAYDGNVGIAKRLQKIIRLKNEQKMEKFNGKNHFCKKNRDERPPNEKNREKRPFLPPLSNTKNEKEKANECSPKKGDEIAKRGNFAVFYLGNRQKTNMRSFNLFLKNRKK